MPYAPPRHGAGRTAANRKQQQRDYNRTKRTGQAFYNSKQLRHRVICKKAGRATPANVVDHIVPIKQGGELLNINNCQSICSLHHNQKSALERDGGGGGRYLYRIGICTASRPPIFYVHTSAVLRILCQIY